MAEGEARGDVVGVEVAVVDQKLHERAKTRKTSGSG